MHLNRVQNVVLECGENGPIKISKYIVILVQVSRYIILVLMILSSNCYNESKDGITNANNENDMWSHDVEH